MEILPSKRFESHSQSANGPKRSFGVKSDKYGSCQGANFFKNDTLSLSRNPENDALFSGTSPYKIVYEYLPLGDQGTSEEFCGDESHVTNWRIPSCAMSGYFHVNDQIGDRSTQIDSFTENVQWTFGG